MNITVLYEDADLVAVNKPAGVLVHGIFARGEARHNEETLVDWATHRYPAMRQVGDMPSMRPGVVHRLDRETSGVMVLAKTQEAFTYLKEQFKNRHIRKTYLALVWGVPKERKGVIDKPISIVDGSVRRTVFKGKMQREAITEYEVVHTYMSELGEVSLVRAYPKTGRTHQIRVHFASINCPLVGDKLYGKKYSLTGLDRHFLHADSLELPLRGGKRITLSAEMPAELQDLISRLTVTG